MTIFDLWKQNNVIRQFKDIQNATAMCFSYDARDIYITTPEKMICLDIRSGKEKWTFDMPFLANGLTVSNNGYFVAANNDSKVVVWNLETREIRKEYEFDVTVNDIAFSYDSDKFGILTNDGMLSLYDSSTFFIL